SFGPQYVPTQQPRNYNPNSYCGFHKVRVHDTRTCHDYNKFMQRLPEEQKKLFIDMFLADPASPAPNTFTGAISPQNSPLKIFNDPLPNHNNNKLNPNGTTKGAMTGNNDHEASTSLNPPVALQLGNQLRPKIV
ncbi:hypothetical protein KI387_016695, partial [Taxus chinensis]